MKRIHVMAARKDMYRAIPIARCTKSGWLNITKENNRWPKQEKQKQHILDIAR